VIETVAETNAGRLMPSLFISEERSFIDKKYIEMSVRLMYCSTLPAVTTASPEAAAINLPFEAIFS
jgi:hypothetical protein